MGKPRKGKKRVFSAIVGGERKRGGGELQAGKRKRGFPPPLQKKGKKRELVNETFPAIRGKGKKGKKNLWSIDALKNRQEY